MSVSSSVSLLQALYNILVIKYLLTYYVSTVDIFMTTEKYSNLMKYLVLSESVATKIIVKLSFSNCFTSKAYFCSKPKPRCCYCENT